MIDDPGFTLSESGIYARCASCRELLDGAHSVARCVTPCGGSPVDPVWLVTDYLICSACSGDRPGLARTLGHPHQRLADFLASTHPPKPIDYDDPHRCSACQRTTSVAGRLRTATLPIDCFEGDVPWIVADRPLCPSCLARLHADRGPVCRLIRVEGRVMCALGTVSGTDLFTGIEPGLPPMKVFLVTPPNHS